MRSKSAGSKVSRKIAIADQQSSKPANRRGRNQRNNQQAQQVLRHALDEEIKIKEAPPSNPLAEAPQEGVKEAGMRSASLPKLLICLAEVTEK